MLRQSIREPRGIEHTFDIEGFLKTSSELIIRVFAIRDNMGATIRMPQLFADLSLLTETAFSAGRPDRVLIVRTR